jgi:hypothetical protein
MLHFILWNASLIRSFTLTSESHHHPEESILVAIAKHSAIAIRLIFVNIVKTEESGSTAGL